MNSLLQSHQSGAEARANTSALRLQRVRRERASRIGLCELCASSALSRHICTRLAPSVSFPTAASTARRGFSWIYAIRSVRKQCGHRRISRFLQRIVETQVQDTPANLFEKFSSQNSCSLCMLKSSYRFPQWSRTSRCIMRIARARSSCAVEAKRGETDSNACASQRSSSRPTMSEPHRLTRSIRSIMRFLSAHEFGLRMQYKARMMKILVN